MLFLIPNQFTWWQTQLFAAKGDYVSGVSGINDLTVTQGKVKQKERKTGAVKMAEQLPSGRRATSRQCGAKSGTGHGESSH